MSSVIATIERAQLRRVPAFAPGDRVKVHFQVIEGARSRVQVFEGVVIKRQGHGVRETFTVRKQSFGVGVERMFPLHSPKIERIELAARGDVRRAKLYYLRDRVGKRARVRERRYTRPGGDGRAGPAGRARARRAAEATDAEGMTAEEAVVETPAVASRPTASPSRGGVRNRWTRPIRDRTAATPTAPRPSRTLRRRAPPRPSSDAGDATGGVSAGDDTA